MKYSVFADSNYWGTYDAATAVEAVYRACQQCMYDVKDGDL